MNGKKGYLVIIGCGHGQVPAFKKAIEMGISTIGVDRDNTAPGVALCSQFLQVDVVDYWEIVKKLRDFPIFGCLTMQSDIGVPTVGFINDHYRLPGITFNTAQICSNKISFRKKMQQDHISQPNFASYTTFEFFISDIISKWTLPVMVKSPDSSGSRGIIKLTELGSAEDAFKEAMQFSRCGEVLVEECISGIEFGSQAFFENGRLTYHFVHGDELIGNIPIGHYMPFEIESDAAVCLDDYVSDVAKAVGLEDGFGNFDFMIDESGKIQILELGARIGATGLPELIQVHAQLDWYQLNLEASIGLRNLEKNIERIKPAVVRMLYSDVDGVFKGVNLPNDNSSPRPAFLEINKLPGDKVKRFTNGSLAVGKVIFLSDTLTGAINDLNRYCSRDLLNIEIK